MTYEIAHLRALESEAIHVIREVAAELERGVLLFSGGKDSAVLLHLARKAFHPAGLPFPVMHVDTGHNFPEVLEYRDRMVADLDARLIVASVQESIDKGRILSFRDDFGQWDPKAQRPELWNVYNGFVKPGEHVRVFPLSNWTELDVWQYIREERIELPSIYFAHNRDVFRRDGMLYALSDYVELLPGEEPFEESVRFRTVGDMSCTGAVASTAATLESVVAEIAATRITERGETRADDRISEAAMEDRKKEGYF
jgi:sulfate adenylyltransferase subunit 2